MLHKQFIRQVRPDLKSVNTRMKMQNIPSKLFKRTEYNEKVGFWSQIIIEYSWSRCSLSLSEKEISHCFHLDQKDCKTIIRHMLQSNQMQVKDDRYIITDNMKQLNKICREAHKGDDHLSIQDLQQLPIWEFLDDKPKNQNIIHEWPNFFYELKYKNNVLFGAKVK
ncbi:Conserved_hypothetical protein [Hexamita inflata]|uniref:Uncharacterized protein n=1 Tax=Hexamita inflata TaxID=28002 RepID=A0AA86TJ78_9EUKA|nr:Conserved hypothetical protein [Hexamita inflata]